MTNTRITPTPDSARNIKARTTMLSLSPEWLDILAQLAVQPRYASEITGLLNLRQSTASNRLSAMRRAGLVDYEDIKPDQHSPTHLHLYRLVPEAIKATADDIRATAQQIEETAAKIESYIKRRTT